MTQLKPSVLVGIFLGVVLLVAILTNVQLYMMRVDITQLKNQTGTLENFTGSQKVLNGQIIDWSKAVNNHLATLYNRTK